MTKYDERKGVGKLQVQLLPADRCSQSREKLYENSLFMYKYWKVRLLLPLQTPPFTWRDFMNTWICRCCSVRINQELSDCFIFSSHLNSSIIRSWDRTIRRRSRLSFLASTEQNAALHNKRQPMWTNTLQQWVQQQVHQHPNQNQELLKLSADQDKSGR